ncbi:hypothetical protein ACLOJK_027256, partial [Asimina triloba]
YLDDGLMPDVQEWMPTKSADYENDGGYTPVLVGWETSIEPKIRLVALAREIS